MNRADLQRAARRRTPLWLRILVLAATSTMGLLVGPQLGPLGSPLDYVVGFGLGVAVSAVFVVAWSVRNPLPPDRNTLANAADPNTLRPRSVDASLADAGDGPEVAVERDVGTNADPLATRAELPGIDGSAEDHIHVAGLGPGNGRTATVSLLSAEMASGGSRRGPRSPSRSRSIVGAVVAGVIAVVIALSRSGSPPPAAFVAGGDLHVGDCFDVGDVSGTGVSPLPSGGVVLQPTDIKPVPCAQEHAFEVFGLTADTAAGQAFPGDGALADESDAACLARFEPYVGIEYQASHLSMRILTPTARSWSQGDRRIQCYLFDPEQSRLTGSQQGTFVPYTSSAFGFRVSIPVGWTAGPKVGDATGTLLSGPDATILVGVDPIRGVSSDALLLADESGLTSAGALDLTVSSVKTGDLDWSIVRYTRPARSGATLGFDAVTVDRGMSLMLIWTSANEQVDAEYARFMEILGSFRPA